MQTPLAGHGGDRSIAGKITLCIDDARLCASLGLRGHLKNLENGTAGKCLFPSARRWKLSREFVSDMLRARSIDVTAGRACSSPVLSASKNILSSTVAHCGQGGCNSGAELNDATGLKSFLAI